MTFPDIMIDIETLGTTPGSLILSIAAVAFNAETGELGGEYQAHIDPESAARMGLTLDVSTVAWWMRQSDAARADAFSGKSNTTLALNRLTQFVTDAAATRIWAKPPSFDIALLEAAYRACGFTAPWHYSALALQRPARPENPDRSGRIYAGHQRGTSGHRRRASPGQDCHCLLRATRRPSRKPASMTPLQIDLARHALGLTRAKTSYRNRFVTGEGSTDHQPWLDMVAAGNAIRVDGKKLPFDGADLFCLTPKGASQALRRGERLDPETFPPESLK